MNEVQKAHSKLSKNALAWFSDFEFVTRSGDHLREFLAHQSEDEFNRRFDPLPPNQQAHLQVLIRARQAQMQQVVEEARELQDSVLDWMNETRDN